MMRIISGQWGGRKIVQPPTKLTRPMPDRVRAAIFDILGSHYGSPGRLPPLRVADVFAGSGSMGLEALSRGAQTCAFFERAPAALKTLRNNIASLNAEKFCQVIVGDAWNRLLTQHKIVAAQLIFLDPPYAESADTGEDGAVAQCLARIRGRDWPAPLTVLHHARTVQYTSDSCPGWRMIDHRTFGTNAVTMFDSHDDSLH